MSAFQIFTQPSQQALDTAANVLSGATLTFSLTGTSTPTNAYSNSTLATPVSNPLSANAAGVFIPVFLDPLVVYRVVLKTQAGAVLQTWDPANENLISYFTQAVIGGLLYPRTAAELAAGVTPVNYAYVELTPERYGGAADNLTDNATAFANMRLVAIQKGGGTSRFKTGTYKTSAVLLFTESWRWLGDGYLSTTINYTGAATFITFTSTSGRCVLSDMTITGTGKTGIGVQIGDTDFSGIHLINRCNINGFATGVRFAGALYTNLIETIVQQNTRGVDFNAGWASGYSTTIQILRCDIRSNDNEGIAATNVPIRNQSITVSGGAIELNCGSSPGTLAQHVMGNSEQYKIDNVYYEYVAAGTKPKAIDASSVACADIMCYVNGASFGVWSGTNGINDVDIHHSRFSGITSNDIFINGGGGTALRCFGWRNLYSATTVFNGTNCYDYTTLFAEQTSKNVAWTPTIKGSTAAGAPTYTVQSAFYSRVGNSVGFKLRVSITAKGGMTGNISIEGLPVASSAGGQDQFVAEFQGITIGGGNTQFYALLGASSTSVLLMQQGSASSSNIVDTQVAAATTIQISGSYQT